MESNGLMGNHPRTISVLMFPWLAHGHISPFLELAKKLTNRNFIIYFCSTQANLIPIKQNLSNKYSISIQLIELHLPTLSDDVDFPPHYHTTNGLPPHFMNTLKQAFDMSCPTFTNILKNLKPDLLIYDFLQPWAATAALELGIPAVDFISSSATMTSMMCHYFLNDNHGMVFPFSSTIYFRDYEMHRHKAIEKAAETKEKSNMHALDSIELSSNIVLIKSFKEIEGKYIDYLSNISGKKFIPLGPLVQESPQHGVENSEIIEWLNEKKQGSTVLVSFGSEYFLSKEDRNEIALGLELSNVNFVWVLRFPKGDEVKLEEVLPKGFVKRVENRGIVVNKWAPQTRILQHESIGGFVSHCGWNSVIEGMKFGVSIIAMPMHLDQPINARLIEEVGVGIEVVRDSEGKLQKEIIAQVINKVVSEKSGEHVRKNAKDMSEVISMKGDEEIDEVVHQLVNLCMKKAN